MTKWTRMNKEGVFLFLYSSRRNTIGEGTYQVRSKARSSTGKERGWFRSNSLVLLNENESWVESFLTVQDNAAWVFVYWSRKEKRKRKNESCLSRSFPITLFKSEIRDKFKQWNCEMRRAAKRWDPMGERPKRQKTVKERISNGIVRPTGEGVSFTVKKESENA